MSSDKQDLEKLKSEIQSLKNIIKTMCFHCNGTGEVPCTKCDDGIGGSYLCISWKCIDCGGYLKVKCQYCKRT